LRSVKDEEEVEKSALVDFMSREYKSGCGEKEHLFWVNTFLRLLVAFGFMRRKGDSDVYVMIEDFRKLL